ncbi:MAG: hypothetical protein E7488_06255 [Ruminococcaceae bacterium]|nr:hypothetical protein [Oscillospiraceae bacterium]
MKKVILILVCSLLFFTSCGTDVTIKNFDIIENDNSSLVYKISLTNEDIFTLIPNEFHDFEYFTFLNLDNDVVYFSTINNQNNTQYTQDIFAYNIESGDVNHILDVTDLFVKIFTVYNIEGCFYLYAEPILDAYKGNKIYLYKNNNIVLLSDTAVNGIVPYENGIAYIEAPSLTAMKSYGTLKTTIASSNKDLYINRLIPNNTSAIIANGSDMNFYYCNYVKGEISKKFSLLNNRIEFLSDIFLSLESDGENKKLSVRNYDGDILATIDETNINSIISNNNAQSGDRISSYNKVVLW